MIVFTQLVLLLERSMYKQKSSKTPLYDHPEINPTPLLRPSF